MLLYLDYDGVLHPDVVYLDARNRVHLHGYGALFEHAALLEALLAPYPLLKIVPSTSWVRIKGFDRARRRLPQGLRKRLIGATWHSRFLQDDHLNTWLAAFPPRASRCVSKAGTYRWYSPGGRSDK